MTEDTPTPEVQSLKKKKTSKYLIHRYALTYQLESKQKNLDTKTIANKFPSFTTDCKINIHMDNISDHE